MNFQTNLMFIILIYDILVPVVEFTTTSGGTGARQRWEALQWRGRFQQSTSYLNRLFRRQLFEDATAITSLPNVCPTTGDAISMHGQRRPSYGSCVPTTGQLSTAMWRLSTLADEGLVVLGSTKPADLAWAAESSQRRSEDVAFGRSEDLPESTKFTAGRT